MTIQTIVTISNSFKTFLQSGHYEDAILKLMNRSKRVFPYVYRYNENQSNGECDFISAERDAHNLVKYDAKLPFDGKEGKMICSKKSDFLKWIQFMMDEASEFSSCMYNPFNLNCGLWSAEVLVLRGSFLTTILTTNAAKRPVPD